MRYQVEVQLRKQGAFQRAPQLDFTVVGKTPSKGRKAAIAVFAGQRGSSYTPLTCGLGTDGKLKLLVLRKSEAEALEQAERARVQGVAARASREAAESAPTEGRRRLS